MAKLKKASVALHICPTCKGNGYIKVATEKGEFYETTDVDYIDDGNSTKLH